MDIESQIRTEAAELERRWEADRWTGIERTYTAVEVVRLRGAIREEHSLARAGAEKLWGLLNHEDHVQALGALTGGQAVEMIKAGLKSIYLSGWQVAADQNLAGQTYPDQSLYPADSVPKVVQRINNALRRADQIAWSEGRNADYLAPIVADAEAGFGGPLNAFELMKAMIEAGASGVHFEDQLASEKKCGHLGGKVLVPTSQFIRTLTAARLAADVLDVPTVLVARTDALAATLLTTDVDERDAAFATGERTAEGFYTVRNGMDAAVARAVAYAPYADMLWCETSTPDLEEARVFAEAVHAEFPGKLLAYNCSPSFNWTQHLDESTIARVPEGARGDGVPVPVHHPRGLPRAERIDVRARARLRERGDERIRQASGTRVRTGVRGLHGDEAPVRGRHRVLRSRGEGDQWRSDVDAGLGRVNGGRSVPLALTTKGPIQGADDLDSALTEESPGSNPRL